MYRRIGGCYLFLWSFGGRSFFFNHLLCPFSSGSYVWRSDRQTTVARRRQYGCNGTRRANCLAITTLLRRWVDEGKVWNGSHTFPPWLLLSLDRDRQRGTVFPPPPPAVNCKCSNKDIILSPADTMDSSALGTYCPIARAAVPLISARTFISYLH